MSILRGAALLFIGLLALSVVVNPACAAGDHLGQDLLPNGDFEDGWNTDHPVNWTRGSKDWSQSLSNGYYGTKALRVTTDRYSRGYAGIRSEEFRVEEGETYLLRSVMSHSNARNSHIKFQGWNTERQQWDNLEMLPGGQTGYSGWVERSVFLTVPEDYTKVRVILQAGYVDDDDDGNATTSFDGLAFIEPSVENPARYSGKVTLSKDQRFWLIDSSTRLQLEEVAGDEALLALIKGGRTLSQSVARAGEDVSLEYDGEEYVVFHVDEVFKGTEGGQVILEEVLGGVPSIIVSRRGVNLVVNPSFEAGVDDGTPVGWSAPNQGWTTEIDTNTSMDGNASLKVSTTRDSGWPWIKGERVSVEGGQTYLFKSSMKARNARGSHIKFWGYKEDGGRINLHPFVPGGQRGTFEWRNFGSLIKIPSDIVQVQPVLNPGTVLDESQGPGVTWIDRVSISLPRVDTPTFYSTEKRGKEGVITLDNSISLLLEESGENLNVTYLYYGFPLASTTVGVGEEGIIKRGDTTLLSFRYMGVKNGRHVLEDVVAGYYGGSAPQLAVESVNREVVVGKDDYKLRITNTGDSSLDGALHFEISGPVSKSIDKTVSLGPGEHTTINLGSELEGVGDKTVRVSVSGACYGTYNLPIVLKSTGTPTAISLTSVEQSGDTTKFSVRVFVEESERFVDPEIPLELRVYRVSGSSKEQVYTEQYTLETLSKEITLSHDDFYDGSGVYLVEFRSGGTYTERSLDLGYGQDIGGGPAVIMLLCLMGVYAARIHMGKRSPLRPDTTALATGVIVAILLFIMGGDAYSGLLLGLFGGGLVVVGRMNERVETLFESDSPLAGFFTLLVVFMGGALLLGHGFDIPVAIGIPLLYGVALSVGGRISDGKLGFELG